MNGVGPWWFPAALRLAITRLSLVFFLTASWDRHDEGYGRGFPARAECDRKFLADAPRIDDFLSGEAQDFFAAVTSGLDAAGVAWTRNPALVRGLDYYRHAAFEFGYF